VISKSITILESVGIQLCNALTIGKKAESELHKAKGEVAVKISSKLRVLQRNPGYATLCKFLTFFVAKKLSQPRLSFFGVLFFS
jgi:hypothetical protein